MNKRATLINRKGEKEFILSNFQHGAELSHAGRRWGFGVALINGEHFYFEY